MKSLKIFGALLAAAAIVLSSTAAPARAHFSGNLLVAVKDQPTFTNLFSDPDWKAHILLRGPIQTSSTSAESGIWLLVQPPTTIFRSFSPGVNPWNFLHTLISSDEVFKRALPSILDAEPDFVFEPEEDLYEEIPASQKNRRTETNNFLHPIAPARKNLPFHWYERDSYTQLAAARDVVLSEFPIDNAFSPLRIGVLDLGYPKDDDHTARPNGLRKNLSADFAYLDWPCLPDSRPSPLSASGSAEEGAFGQRGHGLAVLSLLAGRRVNYFALEHGSPKFFRDYMGAAPQFPLGMIRVGSSLNECLPSAVGRGLVHAADYTNDVASISVYGPPSAFERDAVNYAYQHGVAMIASAGDFRPSIIFGPHSTSGALYPAAFRRVLAVQAVNAERSREKQTSCLDDLDSGWGHGLHGRIGPSRRTIAAYGSSLAVAEASASNSVDLNARGSAFATAEVAAAAALWLQARRAELSKGTAVRAEACYRALLDSASSCDSPPLLKALNSLSISDIVQIPQDPATVGFEWFSTPPLPSERTELRALRMQMARTELAQLVSLSGELERVFGRRDFASGIQEKDRSKFFRIIAAEKCSAFLRESLLQKK